MSLEGKTIRSEVIRDGRIGHQCGVVQPNLDRAECPMARRGHDRERDCTILDIEPDESQHLRPLLVGTLTLHDGLRRVIYRSHL